MKDTLVKLRALLSMKGYLIVALRKDLEAALRIVDRLEAENQELRNQQPLWWAAMNEDTKFIDVLVTRMEEDVADPAPKGMIALIKHQSSGE